MKKLKIMIAPVVFIIVIFTVLLWAINSFQNSAFDTTLSNAQLNNAGYLGESKLFLISANTSYGVHGDQDCFVITATIRNDYTVEELQAFSIYPGDTHTGRVYFAVRATLYDDTSQASANDITSAITGSMSPPLGVPQWNLHCGETDTVEIYMATDIRSVDNYSINLIILELSGFAIP